MATITAKRCLLVNARFLLTGEWRRNHVQMGLLRGTRTPNVRGLVRPCKRPQVIFHWGVKINAGT
jgi:hypothetical protein